MTAHGTPGRRAFTLIEAALSVLIVGIMLTAALRTLSATRRADALFASRARGLALAEDLMAEILEHPYEDPGGLSFGLETGEVATDRTTFDDVDDYHGWTSSPPVSRDGDPIDGATGFTRSVTVERVRRSDPSLTVASDRGVKRITVTVLRGEAQVARLTAWRTRAWARSWPEQGP